MLNKIAESHFNALRAASGNSAQPEITNTQTTPSTSNNALDMFLSTPSFSGKQIAIESLLRQITQGTSPNKTGTIV